MFTIPTTIVLGAGASCGYGYPLGHALIDRMMGVCENWINQGQPTAMHARRLLSMLRHYDPISIDAFLTHYSKDAQLVQCAKVAICEVLFDSADEGRFLRQAPLHGQESFHWYRYLWSAIVSGQTPEELANEKVEFPFNILTFNYDPSLEYYLYSRVTSPESMFTHPQQEAFLRKLAARIHHVYGCIMDYQWCRQEGQDRNGIYSRMTQPEKHGVIARNHTRIHLIDERDGVDRGLIDNRLRLARQIIFLGFGFDETNIGPRVLNLESTLSPRSGEMPVVKFTNLGDHSQINKKLLGILQKHTSSIDYLKDQVIKSTKTVYRAVSEDFSLHSLH